MSKEILILCGSPRENGNTQLLADAFKKGAEAAGNVVNVFDVAQMNIAACKGCDYCTLHQGECIQKDDMQKIMPYLYTANTIVFSTPVYYYGMTAQLKLALDRMYATLAKKSSLESCVLLAVYGDTNTSVVEPLVEQYKAFTGYSGWNNLGIITVPGLNEKGEISGHPALNEAEELGRSL